MVRTELHLYHDPVRQTFRVVAWACENEKEVLNTYVGPHCQYSLYSPGFYRLITHRAVYGFRFEHSSQGSQEAKEYVDYRGMNLPRH